MASISIVIPTYNRGTQLIDVVDHVLKSETSGLNEIEIIVVDDSSSIAAEQFIDVARVKPPFTIQFIVQANSGPAAARINGMKRAKGEVVLFIDDDVLVTDKAVKEHYDAHKAKPGAVIYGHYPYIKPDKPTLAYYYLQGLIDKGVEDILKKHPGEKLVKVESVASGNLSVPKGLFTESNPLYDTSLSVPAAEEYDLMFSLRQRNIPVYFGVNCMEAWHLQPVFIKDKSVQEYKYGMGIAEVCIKKPAVLKGGVVRDIFFSNGPVLPTDRAGTKLKKKIKHILSGSFFRKGLLSVISFLEKTIPSKKILFPLYRLLSVLSMIAGVKEGMKKFGTR